MSNSRQRRSRTRPGVVKKKRPAEVSFLIGNLEIEDARALLIKHGSLDQKFDEASQSYFRCQINSAFREHRVEHRIRADVADIPTRKQFDRWRTKITKLLKKSKLALEFENEFYRAELLWRGQLFSKKYINETDVFGKIVEEAAPRLHEIVSGIAELLKWLEPNTESIQVEVRDKVDRYSLGHTTTWLIGMRLPEIYSQTFGRRFGISETGPGVRFVRDVLQIAAQKDCIDRRFADETVIAYRRRALQMQG